MTEATDCCEPTPFCACEGDTWSAVLKFIDEDGAPIPTANVASITLRLFRGTTIINSRDGQTVLNANGGTYYDTLQTGTDADGNQVDYNFRFDFEDVDNPFLKDDDEAPEQSEVHLAHFRFVTTDGEKRSHILRITVSNIRLFSVL